MPDPLTPAALEALVTAHAPEGTPADRAEARHLNAADRLNALVERILDFEAAPTSSIRFGTAVRFTFRGDRWMIQPAHSPRGTLALWHLPGATPDSDGDRREHVGTVRGRADLGRLLSTFLQRRDAGGGAGGG